MSVGSLGGKLCVASKEYTTPSIVASNMGQVVSAENQSFSGGTEELYNESLDLVVAITDLEVDLENVTAINADNYTANYTDLLTKYVNVKAQYINLEILYNQALNIFGGGILNPADVVKTIGYSTDNLTTINLQNSSITFFGNETYSTIALLGTQTLIAGSYCIYVNLSAFGISLSPNGDRLSQNTLVFGVIGKDTNLIVNGSCISSSNFCEYNVDDDESKQGVLVSITGSTTFTITEDTEVEYSLMIQRDENYLDNTPNYVADKDYSRPAYSGGSSLQIDINNRAVVVVKMDRD